jgi:fructose-bisphosphate aldolase/6-deoxy-5-ketofructose 1-phosphate synthase
MADMISSEDVAVPLDVPRGARRTYINNYLKITGNSGRLMLFAGDQKVEHLNDDFYGPKVSPEDGDPELLFRIASKSKIGVFASQLGLIARYGSEYPKVPYLIKLNSKTNLVKTSQAEPYSGEWLDVEQAVEFKRESGLDILGVGYTVYIGSERESEMLTQAAQLVYTAHKHGLITVLWMYPRGKAVKSEKDPHLVAGAAGVAAALGSDFVKVNYPVKEGFKSSEVFREAVMAAGRTKVVCAGGESCDVKSFLQTLHDQIHISGAAGSATGRNIHQKPLDEAVRMCGAIYAITVENADVDSAWKIYSSDRNSWYRS